MTRSFSASFSVSVACWRGVGRFSADAEDCVDETCGWSERALLMSGRWTRSRLAPSRVNVPRNDQHCPSRAAEHAFSNRAFSEPPPTSAPVRSENDEVGFPGIGMQHDHASGITVLLDGPNGDACALRTLTQAGQELETFALVP